MLAAKQRFKRMKRIPQWDLYADTFEVDMTRKVNVSIWDTRVSAKRLCVKSQGSYITASAFLFGRGKHFPLGLSRSKKILVRIAKFIEVRNSPLLGRLFPVRLRITRMRLSMMSIELLSSLLRLPRNSPRHQGAGGSPSP